jgi:hypothetical protein
VDLATVATLLGGIGGSIGGFATLGMAAASWIRNSRNERLSAAQQAADEAAKRAADEERVRFQKRVLGAARDGRVDPEEAAKLLKQEGEGQ